MRLRIGVVLSSKPVEGAISTAFIEQESCYSNLVTHSKFEEITLRLGATIPIYAPDLSIASRRGVRITGEVLKNVKRSVRNGHTRKSL
jgi:hypothetical protein